MRCREFESRMEALLDGRLPAAEEKRCREHLRSCADCTGLMALAGGSSAAQSRLEAPEELLGAVLAETSGAVCDRALERICDEIDRPLPGAERELVEMHLSCCSDCARTAGVLRTMHAELPLMAEWRTDERFVEDVLRATLPLEARLRRWWREAWPRWVHRPRFALEGAYVATLVLLLIFLTPGSPLEAMPQRALGMVRVDPIARFEQPVATFGRKAEAGARRAWEATGAPIVAAGQDKGGDLSELRERWLDRLESAWGTVRDALASLLQEDATEASSETETEKENS
jgi:hypothetical protein